MPPERDPIEANKDAVADLFPDEEADTQSMSRAPLVAYFLARGVPPHEVDARVDAILEEHAARRALDRERGPASHGRKD